MLMEAPEESFLIGQSFKNLVRVIKSDHANPLGMGTRASRFSSINGSFELLYVASDLCTAIAEGILRDRFEGVHRSERWLSLHEIRDYNVAQITTKNQLILLNLKKRMNLFHLGIGTDAVGAKSHRVGQVNSQFLYHNASHVDGILYCSRLTGRPCIAAYDRAVQKCSCEEKSSPLEEKKQLAAALDELLITLR